MSVDTWRSAEFHDEVRAWVGERLERRGVGLTGEWTQPHARPWSSAIRLGTTVGAVWFKVDGPGTRHEPALLRVLAEKVPGLVPDVLAVSTDRGWSLTGDAGPTLREALSPPESFPVWEHVVREYAAAQVQLVTARDAVLGAGVAEVSPATLPTSAGAAAGGGEDHRLGRRQLGLTAGHHAVHPRAAGRRGGRGVELHTCAPGPRRLPRAVHDVRRPTRAGAPDGPGRPHRCVVRALSWRAALLGVPASAQEEWEFPVRSWLLELPHR